jgi:hypothetical protein
MGLSSHTLMFQVRCVVLIADTKQDLKSLRNGHSLQVVGSFRGGAIMSGMLRLFSALVLLAATEHTAYAADTFYRDPRKPSFTIMVPDGWNAERDRSGVILSRGSSRAQVSVVNPPAQSSEALFHSAKQQVMTQSKNFRELGSGSVRFGGQPGLFLTFSAIPPIGGTTKITRLVVMTDGRLSYLLWLSAIPEEVDTFRRDFDRIQSSFTPDPVH